AADHGNTELRKMSDSITSPVRLSNVNDVEPSTRSRSGRFWNPMTVMPSPEAGFAPVKPTNCEEIETPGTAAHADSPLATTRWSCGAVTAATSRFVTKYRIGNAVQWSGTRFAPTRVPSFKYASSAGADSTSATTAAAAAIRFIARRLPRRRASRDRGTRPPQADAARRRRGRRPPADRRPSP